MNNRSYQCHLNQKLTDVIEASISQDDDEWDMLCVDLWDAVNPKIKNNWRDGTFDVLEGLRTRELYNKKYGNGQSM